MSDFLVTDKKNHDESGRELSSVFLEGLSAKGNEIGREGREFKLTQN